MVFQYAWQAKMKAKPLPIFIPINRQCQKWRDQFVARSQYFWREQFGGAGGAGWSGTEPDGAGWSGTEREYESQFFVSIFTEYQDKKESKFATTRHTSTGPSLRSRHYL